MGDGTGCDNMTAVLIQFKPKLIEKKFSNEKPADKLDDLSKKTKMDADDETAAAVDAIDDVSSRKRSGSPLLNVADETATTNDSHKRLKTDVDNGHGKVSMVDGENDKSAPALDAAATT